MATVTKLTTSKVMAGALARIAKEGSKVDDAAGQILACIRTHHLTTLDAFNPVVADAYQANSWRQGSGRPKADSPGNPAPRSVRIYVSEVRAAYRLNLKVPGFTSMYELREAVAAARRESIGAGTPSTAPAAPEMDGLRVSQPDALTGALFHDLLVVYETLPSVEQDAMEKAVGRVLAKYKKAANALTGPLKVIPAPRTAQNGGATRH